MSSAFGTVPGIRKMRLRLFGWNPQIRHGSWNPQNPARLEVEIAPRHINVMWGKVRMRKRKSERTGMFLWKATAFCSIYSMKASLGGLHWMNVSVSASATWTWSTGDNGIAFFLYSPAAPSGDNVVEMNIWQTLLDKRRAERSGMFIMSGIF